MVIDAKPRTGDTKSAAKVLKLLTVLQRNFAHGFSPQELARETGFNPSDITRYVNTLENEGFAERIAETGRIRPSHKYAQVAVQVLNSLDSAAQRINEAKSRLYAGNDTPINRSIDRLTQEN